MTGHPNLLFLMVDQMQGRVLEPGHTCKTPNLDRLAANGVRFRRAYTPNAVCSPARASLMTGLLPHNHGVLWVTHTVDEDQGLLRTERVHWAQSLTNAGYRTGYFGKWHVERTEALERFGWHTNGCLSSSSFRGRRAQVHPRESEPSVLAHYYDETGGYQRSLHYGVTRQVPEERSMGIVTGLAEEWLTRSMREDGPWCCFVSLTEPHDPFVAGQQAYSMYSVDDLPLPESAHDELRGRPALYKRAARPWAKLTDRQRREAAACYYASITEIDELFGRLIRLVEDAGQKGDTLIIFTSDHGELLGAHGMYCKNFTASEEIYNVPLVISGPGIPRGESSDVRVGLHDLGATIPDLTAASALSDVDGRSIGSDLRSPSTGESRIGYAEYNGGRYLLTQRIIWDDPWKFVFNGFDEDELYNLGSDPHEMWNLADDPYYGDRAERMMGMIWDRMRETGDRSLLNSQYPALRLAVRGPLSAKRAAEDSGLRAQRGTEEVPSDESAS